ncbi:MAG: AAA family ATPase [Solirubrobacterales bacterium]
MSASCERCGAAENVSHSEELGATLCGDCFAVRAITTEGVVRADHRELHFTSAADIQPRRVRWLWRDRIALAGISALVGPGGLGKSTFAAWLTAQVTNGTLPGDLEGEPSLVLLGSLEDTEAEVLAPRLIAAGADLSKVRFPKLRDDGTPAPLTFPEDLELLAQGVRAYEVRLVILDPLVGYVGEQYDTHRDHHVRRVLAPLAELAEDLEAAIFPLVHVNKKDARNVLERVGGSVAFVNAPRSVLALGRDPDEGDDSEQRVLAHAKSNWGPLQASLAVRIETSPVHVDGEDLKTSRAVIDGESRVAADELFTSRSPEEREERADARSFLLEALSEGPRVTDDLRKAAEKAGLSWRSCQRQRAKLRIESERQGFGEKATWALPPTTAVVPPVAPGGEGGATGTNGGGEGGIDPSPAQSRHPAPPGATDGLATPEEDARAAELMARYDDEEVA